MRHRRERNRGGALLCMILAAALVLVISAGAGRALERDRLVAFLDVTGFDVALGGIALSAEDAPAMLGLRAEEFGDDWTRLAGEVFETARMRGTALEILEQTLSEELLAHAVEFYASPLGVRLVAAENVSHMVADARAHRERGADRIAALVADGAPRLVALQRLMRAIAGTADTVRATQEIQIRFLLAASEAGVIDRGIDVEGLRALMRAREPAMRIEMKTAALADAAETYRDFSVAEIEAYTDALEDPRMQRVYELMNATQFEIMAERFEALAWRMAELQRATEL